MLINLIDSIKHYFVSKKIECYACGEEKAIILSSEYFPLCSTCHKASEYLKSYIPRRELNPKERLIYNKALEDHIAFMVSIQATDDEKHDENLFELAEWNKRCKCRWKDCRKYWAKKNDPLEKQITEITWIEDLENSILDPQDGKEPFYYWKEDMRHYEVYQLVKDAYERGLKRGVQSGKTE